MTKPLPRAYAIHMAIVSLLSSYASQVLAGGTALSENNISGIGNAYAGAAVEANDPSVLFANPAALTRFKRAELVQGVIVPTVRAKYVSNAGDNTAEDGSASPAGRSYERDTPARVVAPFNYLAVPINDRTVFGASISGSHGLVVRYPQEYPGRTQSTDTDLKVIRINTGLGYKLTDKLSVGGNLSFETFFTDIKTHINYATAVGGVTGIPAPLINAATNLRESSANIRVFGNAFNAQVGAMFEPSERMRFGIGYRPKTKFKNKGYLHIEQDAAQKNFVNTLSTASPAQGAQLGENQTVDQDITLPDELNMSAFFNVSPKLDLMASYIRQNFTVTKLRFTRRADGSVLEDVPQDFQVAKKVALGLNYRPYRRLTLRAGIAKENSVVSDQLRVPTLPDSDRMFYAFGGGLELSRDAQFNFGYERIKFKEAPVGNNKQITPPIVQSYTGVVKADVDFFGVQLNQRF